MATRQQLLNYGLANKKSIGDINKAMSKNGYPTLSQMELGKLKNVPMASDNPLIRLGQNAVGDLGEITKGLSTIGTLGYQEARKIKQNPQQELGNIQKALVDYGTKRGVGGVAEDIANIGLSTYNTKVSDFGKLPAKQIIKNVAQGAYENPLFTAMDLAPATKLLPKGSMSKAIHALPIPEGVKAFVPTKEMESVNKIIKAQKLTNEVKTSPAMKTIQSIRNNPKVDMQQISKNLILGERKGNEATLKATEEFAKVNTDINKTLHTNFGLSPATTKQEAVSKYILENINPSVGGTKYYHGSPNKFDILDFDFGQAGSATANRKAPFNRTAFGKGLYGTTDIEGAKEFGKYINEFYVDPKSPHFAQQRRMYDEELAEAMAKNPDAIFDFIHGDIANVLNKEAISKTPVYKRLKDINVDAIKKDMANYYAGKPTEYNIEDLIERGNKLYDEGKIRHISEVMRPTTGQTLGVDDLEKNSFLTQRVQGLTTPEQLGDVLLDTYEFLNKQVTKSKTALDSFNEIASTLGKKITPAEATSLGKDEILISPTALQQKLGKSLHGGNRDQIDTILKKLTNSTLGQDAVNKYGADLYKVDKNLLKGLINANTKVMGGGAGEAIKKSSSLFKSAQLVTPKWFIENRIGNTLLNTLEGVTPKDYLDANRQIGKYYKDIPMQLEQATSYAGYLGDNFAGSKTLEGMMNAVKSTGRAIKSGKPLDIFTNANQIFSSPVVGLESSFEKVDRWANMIKQAKRYAKENNLDADKVIKSIKHDDKLFDTLNRKVDESLGDYLGKNYFINPAVQELASLAVPFYKYPTQSGKVVMNQLVNRPLSSQAMINLPAKKGNEIYEEQAKATGIGNDELGGLIRELSSNKREPSVMERFSANPTVAPFELAYQILSGKGSDVMNNMAPLLSDVQKILTFRDKYGNMLTDPNLINIGNKALIKDEEGRPTRYLATPDSLPTGTRAKAILAMLANRFSVPVVQANRALLPAISAVKGEPYYPAYDTTMMGQIGDKSVPFLFQGKAEKEGKQGLSELLGTMAGLRTSKVYPERITAGKSELRKAFRKYATQMKSKGNK